MQKQKTCQGWRTYIYVSFLMKMFIYKLIFNGIKLLSTSGKIVEKKVCPPTESVNGPRVLLSASGGTKPADVQVSSPTILDKVNLSSCLHRSRFSGSPGITIIRLLRIK